MEFTEEEQGKIKRLNPLFRMILNQLKIGIEQIINGDCDYNELEKSEILDSISSLISPTRPLSKAQAARMLNVSERQFNRYIEDGELPKGKKVVGFKELSWETKVIKKFMASKKHG